MKERMSFSGFTIMWACGDGVMDTLTLGWPVFPGPLPDVDVFLYQCGEMHENQIPADDYTVSVEGGEAQLKLNYPFDYGVHYYVDAVPKDMKGN